MAFCDFDMGLEGLWDCEDECLEMGCGPSLLGNGVCDSQCQSAACGYDKGDCGYCAVGCSLDMLENARCDEACNVQRCAYDRGNCGECALGCWAVQQLGNGLCENECNVEECSFDAGDCALCAQDCSLDMLGDGECQPACLTALCGFDGCDCEGWASDECYLPNVGDGVCDLNCYTAGTLWDGGDCDCSPGCSHDFYNNENCDLSCATSSCKWDQGHCVTSIQGICALDCFESMLGNNICETACNTAECGYDHDDCLCNKGCSYLTFSSCSDACLVYQCNFGNFGAEDGCQNAYLRDLAMATQALKQRYSAGFHLTSACMPSDSYCDDEMLHSIWTTQSCYYHIIDGAQSLICNTWDCSYALGHCYPSLDISCVRGFGDNPTQCFQCKAVYVRLYSTCLQYCPRRYYIMSDFPGLCVPRVDTSTISNQDMIYVADSKKEGLGTLASPYGNLGLASSAAWQHYTTIYLLGPSILMDLDLTSANPEIMTREVVDNKAVVRMKITSLTCDQSLTERCSNRITEIHIIKPIADIVNYYLILENVILTSERLFEDLSVKFCPNLVSIDGEWLLDTGLPASEDYIIASTVCEQFRQHTVLTASSRGVILLRNVEVKNLAIQPRALIEIQGGDVILENVNFVNVTTIRGQIGGLCLQIAPCYDVVCGSFSYTNGKVQYLNNGYRYTDGLQQTPFLFGQHLSSVAFTNVTFEHNLVVDVEASTSELSSAALIYLETFYYLSFVDCRFEANFVTGGLVVVSSNVVLPKLTDSSNIAYMYAEAYIHFQNVQFDSNLGENSLVTLEFSRDVMNVDFSEVHFTNNAVEGFALVAIQNDREPALGLAQGEWKQLISATTGKVETVWIPPRSVHISNVQIRDTGSGSILISVENCANLNFIQVEIHSNGDHDVNAVNSAFQAYISDPNILAKQPPELPKPSTCTHLVHLSGNINSVLEHITVSSNLCENGQCGFSFPSAVGNISVTEFYMSGNQCNDQDGSGLAVFNDIQLVVSHLNATNNVNKLGGVLYVGMRSRVTLTDLLLQGNKGVNGAAITCDRVHALALTRVVLRGNTAEGAVGGGIYIMAGNLYSPVYSFSDCLFDSNSADLGGVLAIQTFNITSISLQIVHSQFHSNSATGYGAALYIDSMLDLVNTLVSDCVFSGHSTVSGVLSLGYKSGSMRISNCRFEGNSGRDVAVIFIQTEKSAVTIFDNVKFARTTKAPTILKANSRFNSTFTTLNCEFTDNEKSDVILESGYWQDFNSAFTYSTVSEFYFSAGAVAALTGTVIRNSFTTYQGGAIHLLTGAVLHCENCQFLNNSAGHSGGAIYAEQDSTVIVRNSQFRSNRAVQNGAVLQLISSVSTTSLIESCLIELNSVGETGIIFAQSSFLILSNVTFRSNEGKKCPGVVLMVSKIRIEGCRFANQTGQQAAFLVALTSSTVSISNSKFEDGKVKDGGCFEISSSAMTISNSSLTSLQGGAVFLNSDCILTLTKVTMSDMSSDLEGSLISSLYSTLIVVDSVFTDFRDSGIHGFQMDNVTISGCRFAFGRGKLGGAFQCYQCAEVRLEWSEFTDLRGDVAGAVSLWAQSSSFLGKAFITNSIFLRNTADVGGALQVTNYFLSIANSQFEGNRAVEGGAIHLDCVVIEMCNFAVSSSAFTNNSAEVKGGSIAWLAVKPQLTHLTFAGNSAMYGPDIGSYPTQIVLNSVSGRSLSRISDFPPGQQTPVTLSASILDHYGQIITTDNSSMAVLASTNPSSSVLGAAKVIAVQGTFLFNDFKVYGAPASPLNLTLSSSAVSTDQPGDPDPHIPSILLTFELRDCVPGETKTLVSCDVCSAGTYSFDPLTPCQTCPAHAQCLGNFTLTPDSGYWRSGNFSHLIRACLNSGACLGGQVPEQPLSLTGYCSTGYENNLCQACQAGYSRSGKNNCGKCPDNSVNIVRLAFILLGLILVLAFLVWSTLRASTRPKAEYSILFKIMANYLQLVTLILGFKLKWPQEVVDAYTAQTSMGGTADEIFSIDCLLQHTTSPDAVHYRKLVILVLLPVVFISASVFFWGVVAWKKRNWVLMRRECAATIVIMFFLILPTLVDALFSLFSCMEIETGEYWLITNLSLKCWNSSHRLYMLVVGLPGLVVWVFGVPLLCLCVLIRNRRKQDEIWMKLQYGFLISGYKRTCYYWEFVILYRKVLIIICAVFITNFMPIRALTIQIVLLVAFFLQVQVEPYTTKSLNRTETLAILTADVTIYCGLYYLTEQLSIAASWVLFTFIVTANIVFFLYWLYALICSLVLNVTPIQKLLRLNNFQDNYMDQFIENHSNRQSDLMAGFATSLQGNMRRMVRQSLPVTWRTLRQYQP